MTEEKIHKSFVYTLFSLLGLSIVFVLFMLEAPVSISTSFVWFEVAMITMFVFEVLAAKEIYLRHWHTAMLAAFVLGLLFSGWFWALQAYHEYARDVVNCTFFVTCYW